MSHYKIAPAESNRLEYINICFVNW